MKDSKKIIKIIISIILSSFCFSLFYIFNTDFFSDINLKEHDKINIISLGDNYAINRDDSGIVNFIRYNQDIDNIEEIGLNSTIILYDNITAYAFTNEYVFIRMNSGSNIYRYFCYDKNSAKTKPIFVAKYREELNNFAKEKLDINEIFWEEI